MAAERIDLAFTRFENAETLQVDLPRMVAIITTSTPWIVNIYVVQILLMFTFTVLGTALR